MKADDPQQGQPDESRLGTTESLQASATGQQCAQSEPQPALPPEPGRNLAVRPETGTSLAVQPGTSLAIFEGLAKDKNRMTLARAHALAMGNAEALRAEVQNTAIKAASWLTGGMTLGIFALIAVHASAMIVVPYLSALGLVAGGAARVFGAGRTDPQEPQSASTQESQGS